VFIRLFPRLDSYAFISCQAESCHASLVGIESGTLYRIFSFACPEEASCPDTFIFRARNCGIVPSSGEAGNLGFLVAICETRFLLLDHHHNGNTIKVASNTEES
jgi:hypothetical protein